MNKTEIIVPSGVRFISDWSNGNYGDQQYHLEDFAFPHILNKKITGCGYTEYCIINNQNLVLCSPRILLLENKLKQHEGEFNVFYVKNDFEKIIDYEKDLSGEVKRSRNSVDDFFETEKKPDSQIAENILKLKERIRVHCLNCIGANTPFKILVTYDSFRHVKEVLVELGLMQETQVVIDEFQSVLVDARFKSSAELELLFHLTGLNKICFVSATPLLEEYLDMIDEFKGLPYFELDWKTQEPDRVKVPDINVKLFTRGLGEEVKRVIDKYRAGKFEKVQKVDSFGNPIEIVSNEAVIFLNSVKDICTAIKKNRLTPWETNVLCARTSKNETKVRMAFDKVLRELYPSDKSKRMKYIGDAVGSVPIKGEKHKMFTFCTRTVYLGADFYSTCARTFVFSDSNIDCLAVDVSMDLEQILGRQRLDENPWKNTANLYIKTTRKKYTQAEFDEKLRQKKEKSNCLLDAFLDVQGNDRKNAVAETYERDAAATNYKYNYVAVNNHVGLSKVPVFNNIVYVSEIRAYRIQQETYKDLYSVFNAMQGNGLSYSEFTDVDEHFNEFNSCTTFVDKMRSIEKTKGELSPADFYIFTTRLPVTFQSYINIIGLEKCKALSYRELDIQRYWEKKANNNSLEDKLRENIYSNFSIGDRYTKVSLKEKLGKLYEEIGYKATPKATDLEKYFKIKHILLTNKDAGKRENGFEILEKLG